MKIRDEYNKLGIAEFYRIKNEAYSNPHEKFIEDCLLYHWSEGYNTVLDMACGDGLVTKYLKYKKMVEKGNIYGCDAYLNERYEKETKEKCYKYSFEEISKGEFDLQEVDIIIMSYAIDLVDKSYLNNFLYSLSTLSENLLIIRPNKHILPESYWKKESHFFNGKSKSVLYKNKRCVEW